MKIEEIEAEIAADFQPVNRLDLQTELITLSGLPSKYMKLKREQGMLLGKLENERRLLLAEKIEYYSGNAAPEVYAKKPFDLRIKTDKLMQRYLDTDQDLVQYDNRITAQKEKVAILTAAMKELENRRWLITTLQKQIIFENGGI